jgi:hypothetical protein
MDIRDIMKAAGRRLEDPRMLAATVKNHWHTSSQ